MRSSATDPQPSRGGDRKQSEGKDRRSDPRDESDHRPRESGRGSDRQLASSSSRDAAPSSREPAISPRGDEKPADRGDRERERERERDRDRGRRGRESNRQEVSTEVDGFLCIVVRTLISCALVAILDGNRRQGPSSFRSCGHRGRGHQQRRKVIGGPTLCCNAHPR